jgi:hypothetical protein
VARPKQGGISPSHSLAIRVRSLEPSISLLEMQNPSPSPAGRARICRDSDALARGGETYC